MKASAHGVLPRRSTGKHQESPQVIVKDNTKDEKARGNAGFKFVCAAAKRNRRAKMSDTAIVSEQSVETRSRGSGAGFGGGIA